MSQLIDIYLISKLNRAIELTTLSTKLMQQDDSINTSYIQSLQKEIEYIQEERTRFIGWNDHETI